MRFGQPWTWKRLFYRGLTTASMVLSPLFAFFVYQSIGQVQNLILQEWGAEENPQATALLSSLTIYFTATYFLGDPFYLNPIEESEELLASNVLEEKESSLAVHRFVRFNKTLALGVFAHFAADDALALACLTSNNRSIYLGLGLPFTLISMVHQHVVNKRDIETHSRRFIQALTQIHTSKSFLLDIKHAPLLFLEVVIEAFSEIAYDSIGTGYIADQLAKVFGLEETDPAVLPWMLGITCLTAYLTAFLKTLPPYQEYFNPQFKNLRVEDFKDLTCSFTHSVLNGGIALSRAGALGWLTARFGPGNGTVKGVLASSISVVTFIHSFHVLRQKRRYEAALANYRSRRLFQASGEEPHELEKLTEETRLFNKISKYYETPAVEYTVTFINVSGRIGRLLTFVGFIAEILGTLQANNYLLHFEFKDILALAILWGSPIVILEGKTNQQPLAQALAYYRAKWLIGAPTEELAKSSSVARFVSSFFYSKEQFSKKRLQKALENLEPGEEVEMRSLMTPQEPGSP